jgi:hypothetical protein
MTAIADAPAIAIPQRTPALDPGPAPLSPARGEFSQIQQLIRRQLVDSILWTAAGERAYIAAAGDNGLTIIGGRSELILEWSALQRVYGRLRNEGSLSILTVQQALHGGLEQASAIIGILALLGHVETNAVPPILGYHRPAGPIHLVNPSDSPFAANG